MAKRRFMSLVVGVPMWCGNGVSHVAFRQSRQAEKMRQAVAALRERAGRGAGGWAMGWEGDKFVIGFKTEVGGC